MNNQRRAQKNLTPDCSGHVAQANGVHEQVQKTNARPQGRNETLGHSNGPGTKKPPKGPSSEQIVHTQRPTSP